MKSAFLIFFAILYASFTNAQLTFEVTQPVNLRGVYPAQEPGNNWGSPNLLVPGVWFTGSVIVSFDGVLGSACSPLTNNVTGQYALAYNSNCSMSEQLLNIQNAGALGAIMVDTTIGRPLKFDADSISPSITIPFILISEDEGDSLYNAFLNNEAPEIAFGNKSGFNQNDLSLRMDKSLWSSYGVYRTDQWDSQLFQNDHFGAWIHNTGQQVANDISLRFFAEEGTAYSLLNLVSDTMSILPGDSMFVSFFPDITCDNCYNTMNYGYEILGVTADDDTLDNRIQFVQHNSWRVSQSFIMDDTPDDIDYIFKNKNSDSVVRVCSVFDLENFYCTWEGGMGIEGIQGAEIFVEIWNLENWDSTSVIHDESMWGWGFIYPNESKQEIIPFNADTYWAFENPMAVCAAYYELDTVSFGFSTDMYHDERRRQDPAARIQYLLGDSLVQIDDKITQILYFNLGTHSDCYWAVDEIQESTIKLFPNPSNGLIEITSENPMERIEVTDLFGNSILKLKMEDKLSMTWDSSLPQGAYFVHVLSKGDLWTLHKLVIL